jgi:hypothetical protein
MSTQIRELRISFAWFERWGNIWSPDKPIAMEFLRSTAGYVQEFDRMMAETVQPAQEGKPVTPERQTAEALTPPWPFTTPQYRHWFWRYFLGSEPANLAGQNALQKVVPFRTRFPAKIVSGQPWIRVITDGFVYPHGVGLLITLRLYFDRGDWPAEGITLEKALQSAVDAYVQEKYECTWDNTKKDSGTVASLAGWLLDHLRARVLGPGAAAGIRSAKPFTVASVIRGDTDLASSAPAQDTDLHAALQGLCNLRNGWQADSMTPFAKSLMRVRQSGPKSHAIYATALGRAIWYPVFFSATGPHNRTVGCYHRNLCLLQLQTEALIQALAARAVFTAAGTPVPDYLQEVCKWAATSLQLLYASESDTYRSSSPRTYLDGNLSLKKIVESTLKDLKMDPLKYQEAAT